MPRPRKHQTPLVPVSQEDPKGCGLAVVACVTGRPYATVKRRAIALGLWRPKTGLNRTRLRALLVALNYPVRCVTRGPGAATGVAILNVHGRTQRRWRHWLVVDHGRVLNTDGNVYPSLHDYLAWVNAASGSWYWVQTP